MSDISLSKYFSKFSVIEKDQNISKMPRFYPDSNCDLYLEHLRDNYHDPGREILRKNQHQNPVVYYRTPTKRDPNRSTMSVWGSGEKFLNQTGFKAEKFIRSRIRRDFKLPTAGEKGLWKITQVGCVGMEHLPLHTWNLRNDWLRKSSFRSSQKKVQ